MSQVVTRSAPVGGWNARDSLDQMHPSDAVQLDNLFPDGTRVAVRPGHTLHCPTPDPVETVAPYEAGPQSKLFAAAGGTLYDATLDEAATLKSGFSQNRWQWTNFNSNLIMVNGEDWAQRYTGEEFIDNPVTGVDATTLVNVMTHKSRLYYAVANSPDFYYGGTNLVQGELTRFPLSRVGGLGGNLVAMASWTRDGGAGMNDLAVFFLSTGEVAVYAGSDPGDASNWALQGIFQIGAPVGPRALTQFGGDVVAITTDGYVSLGKVLSRRSDRSAQLSDKIGPAVAEQIRSTSHLPGWQPIALAREHMLIFNYPTSAANFEQHVLNTHTGAWCRFRKLPGNGLAVWRDRLYAGGDDGVYRLMDGGSDNGAAIPLEAVTAFDYLGSRAQRKKMVAVRVVLAAEAALAPTVTVSMDFAQRRGVQLPPAQTPDDPDGIWDDAEWDVSRWAGLPTPFGVWLMRGGMGYNASIRMMARSNGQVFEWYSTSYMFEKGGLT